MIESLVMKDTINWLSHLNPQQYEAVTLNEHNCLVLAGAGSGKTGVLVHRIAWILKECHIQDQQILAVTFTNKAANEMRSRIEALCDLSTQRMWVGTFHGLAHKMLRLHYEKAGLPSQFTILDSDDQLRIVKRIIKDRKLDDEKWPPKNAQAFINRCKQQGRRSDQVITDGDYHAETMLSIYIQYERVCEQGGLVDFTELLLRSYELLQQHEDIRHHYQQRFRHILVDEFQDTNHLQYQWLQCFYKSKHNYIMVVGDDDQSIYSWRGAKVSHMHRFEKDFAPVLTVRLEQNYRSTQTILNAANQVISHNQNRLGKELWTQGKQGENITLYTAFNERDEAYYILSRIESLFAQGHSYSDMTILYRSNAQSRILEERFLDKQVPYRIYGGQKFFDRAEIKDMVAYLRLLLNPDDNAAFDRVINTPPRGIGLTTLDVIRQLALEREITLWQAMEQCIEEKQLSARAIKALQAFIHLIQAMLGSA